MFIQSEAPLVAQQTHATFERGDVFVAVSNGRVQWHLPDGTYDLRGDFGRGRAWE